MRHYVTVKIWEPITQSARTMRYEVPLAGVLYSQHLGEITGVDAVMTRELEIEHVEYQMVLADLDKAVETVRIVLEDAGAPSGSEILFRRNETVERIPFGRKECLAIYMDGINLPDKVYDTCSCQDLANLIFEPLKSLGGEIRGSWVGRNETSIYLFGPDAEAMYSLLKPIVATYPLCQNARIVIRLGNPDLHPRTIRLPFHENPEAVKQVYWTKKQGTG